MGMTTFFILLALLILAPQGLSKGSFYGDYDYTDVVYYQEQGIEPPTFLARPQTFRVEVGQSVIIPCDVENPGGRNKLIIKKVPASGGSEKLLSVGSDRVTPDARITVDGSRLTISHTRLRDAGTFICQFDLEPPVQLRHTLDIQYAPSIRALVPREQRVAKGNTVFLECKAQGNPEPVIRWSRKEGDLPSGHRTEQGERLTLEAVDRHMEGTYLCTADNGIGEPAAADMSVTVEYPPEITVENAIVRTGVGDHVELVCVVHGRPPPDVVWTHNGSPLPDTIMDTQLHLPQQTTHTRTSYQAHLSQTHIAHRHILTINPVKEDDIGTYICIANNSRGQKTAPIEVTSLPKPPQVTSSPNGGESTRYTLTWETESYYPITEFIIKYRRTHMDAWQGNHDMVMTDSWKSVSRAVDTEGVRQGTVTHSVTYTLDTLEVATDYVAVIRVRNKHGWSAESENFFFSTKKVMAVQQSTSGAASLISTSAITLLMLLLALVVTAIQKREHQMRDTGSVVFS
ncbi:hypothetical protein OTU49_016881 [Cherax quadricarinatus]|uniref:Uncharacterized protein n=1 Tax=Cherax quadricarinatus TaxID=27406 RepID=A0AAW0XV97_CHEQU